MKIAGISNLYGVYNNKPAVSRKKTSDSNNTDAYDVSREGKDFHNIYRAVMQTPDIREDKVNSISEQIANGTYHVSAGDLADKILSRA